MVERVALMMKHVLVMIIHSCELVEPRTQPTSGVAADRDTESTPLIWHERRHKVVNFFVPTAVPC
jgi:hypothetical protein